MAEKQFGRPLNGPFSARFWLQIRSGCSDCNGLQKTCRHISDLCLGWFLYLSLLKWARNNLGGLITGPFQLYFGSRSDPVAPIATSFKKPKDIYKTCDWEDFHTFHCLNGRETIWEASKRALFSTILAPDQIRSLRLQRPSKNLKTHIRPVFGVIFIPLTA